MGLTTHGDDAKLLLILCQIVLQRNKQTLGVLGGKDDATLHLGLGQTGEGCYEVGDEFGLGMGEDDEIGVGAACNLGTKLYLELVFFGIVICHNCCENVVLSCKSTQKYAKWPLFFRKIIVGPLCMRDFLYFCSGLTPKTNN